MCAAEIFSSLGAKWTLPGSSKERRTATRCALIGRPTLNGQYTARFESLSLRWHFPNNGVNSLKAAHFTFTAPAAAAAAYKRQCGYRSDRVQIVFCRGALCLE